MINPVVFLPIHPFSLVSVLSMRFCPQLTVFKDQNSQLLQEFASLSQQLGEAQEEYGLLEHHLNRLLGEPVALESVTIDECEELEKTLKTALERIEAKKVSLLYTSGIVKHFFFCFSVLASFVVLLVLSSCTVAQ